MDRSAGDSFWVDEHYPVNQTIVGNGVFSYRQAGSQEKGTPVIALLHGIGSGSGSWAHMLSYFEDHYRVLAWDAPGYNFSTSLSDENRGASGYARALNDFLSSLEVNPRIIVGHSLGAMIAGAYAAEVNPSLPVLILADPANGYGRESPKLRAEKLTDRLNMVRELGPDGMAEMRSKNLLSSFATTDALELVIWNMRKVTVHGYEQASNTLVNGNLSGRAQEYRGRVLVLCGGEDHVTPVDACQEVAKAYSNSPFEILPKLGHASYVEGPKLFNTVVEDFLKTLDV